ncbi:hypothetical protein AWV79_18055 [Cupriavidus sp. UYMMa02A]|nr:hypothetical protein AWV79_18055 [Cupriavidus sp. UYMMa02A]
MGLTRFQTQRSFALRFENEQRSLDAERILHRVFADWRCSPQEVAQADGAGEGASEFFRVECYERLVHFIHQNRDLLLQTELVEDVSASLNRAGDEARQQAREAAQRARDTRQARRERAHRPTLGADNHFVRRSDKHLGR